MSAARALVVLLAAGAALACRSPAPGATAAITRTALAPAGEVIGVVELGDALYVLARDHVTIERAGSAAVTVPAPSAGWAEAIAMPALDEPGRWVVARTTSGELWRITADGDLESIHDRLGVPPHVRSIAASSAAAAASSAAAVSPSVAAAGSPEAPGSQGPGSGPGSTVVFAQDDGIAVLRDRAHLARYAVPGGAVSASAERIVIRRGDQLDVWNLVDQTRTAYRVPGAITAVFAGETARGTLVVATRDALFVEAGGALHRIAAPAELRAVAVAGSHVWIATARGVELLDGDALVHTAMPAAATDHVFGLASGDVVVGGSLALARLTIERPEEDPGWRATVRPIFERVCARCHRPGGDAAVDLSTAAAWRRERAELVRRVVETRTMPPAGIRIDDADRRALAGWLSH